MNTAFILTCAIILTCFFMSYTWFAIINKALSSDKPTKINSNAFIPYFSIAAIGSIILYIFLPLQYDQIYDITLLNISLIFGGSLLTYLGFQHSNSLGIGFLIITTIIGTLLLPQDFMLFNGFFPLIIDRLLTFILWSGFAFCYQYLNGLEGLVATQTAFPLIGTIILSFIGALPFLLGGMGGILLSCTISFAIYNWYPSRLKLSNKDCQALGLLLSGYYILCLQEGCATPILIFSTYYVLDVGLSLIKRLSQKPRYQNIQANTITYQTNISGLAPSLLCENISRLNGLLLIFGCFQAYSPNNYSLFAFGVVLSLWFLHHLQNWQTPEHSFSEINKEILSDIKSNVKKIKNDTNKDE